MIEVQQLEKRYGTFRAVKGVDFSIGKGEIIGLLGPNGAGKTTIMNILTCYHFPSDGKAVVQGYDVIEDSLKVKSLVGYLPETAPVYPDLTVVEYLEFIARARKISGKEIPVRIKEVLEECGLSAVAYRSIDNLSKGYKQRVGLAQAIIHSPPILILDEPTTGLDPNQIIEIRQLIKKLGKEKTVILSTHILQEVEAVCDRVLILNEGRIAAAGTPEEIGKELRGNTLVTAVVKGVDKGFEKELKRIEGVSAVQHLGSGNSAHTFRLTAEDEAKVCEALFDLVVSKSGKLLSLVPQQDSLEDIFIKLTSEGGK